MLHVVCVGVNHYIDPDISNLRCARADAESFAALIRMRVGEEEHRVQLFLDDDATRKQVTIAVGEDLPRVVEPDDVVLLYFACHGSREKVSPPDKESLYLALHDTEYERIFATGIDMDLDVSRWLERLRKAKLVILILDACFSGRAGGRTFKGPHLKASKVYRSTDRLSIKNLDLGQGQVILTAAREDQVAREDDVRGHGIFTYHLLDILKRAPVEQATISVAILYDEVVRAVRRDTGGRQVPMLNGNNAAAALPLFGRADTAPMKSSMA
jgi:uncharacterized caspase-like protein